MLIRCPACGCESSLESLVDNEPAAQALNMVLDLLPFGRQLTRYLAMFRPAKSKLSWQRVNLILSELLPMIKAGEVERNGELVAASQEVWTAALEKVLQARDLGTLKTPLKTHGYLLEVIVSESQKAGVKTSVVRVESVQSVKPLSKAAQSFEILERIKQEAENAMVD